MKRKFNQGGLAEATGAAIRNRIAEMVGEQNKFAEEDVPKGSPIQRDSGLAGLGSGQDMLLSPKGAMQSLAMQSLRDQGGLGVGGPGQDQTIPMSPEEKNMQSDLQMRRRRPMTPYGKPAFAKGGSVKSKGIDGCAQRGKTRGRYL